MIDRPLITFVLFSYNQEEFIREAIEGAFAQTYEPLEIILSDDASSDKTFEIMSEMAKEYLGPHKVVLNRNHVNLGVVPHVNKVVLELSHGDIIVAAAGDDISFPERTDVLHGIWNKHNGEALLLMSEYSEINSQSETIKSCTKRFSKHGVETGDILACLDCYIAHGATMMYDATLMRKFGGLVAPIEDVPLFFRAMLLGKVYYHETPLVKIRKHESMSRFNSFRKEVLQCALWEKAVCSQLMIDLKTINEDDNYKLPGVSAGDLNKAIDRRIRLASLRVKSCDGNAVERFLGWCQSYREAGTFGAWVADFRFVFPEFLERYYMKIFNCIHKIYRFIKKGSSA